MLPSNDNFFFSPEVLGLSETLLSGTIILIPVVPESTVMGLNRLEFERNSYVPFFKFFLINSPVPGSTFVKLYLLSLDLRSICKFVGIFPDSVFAVPDIISPFVKTIFKSFFESPGWRSKSLSFSS